MSDADKPFICLSVHSFIHSFILVVSLKEHGAGLAISPPLWFENEVTAGRECVSQQALQFSQGRTAARVNSQNQNSGQVDTTFAILCSPVHIHLPT